MFPIHVEEILQKRYYLSGEVFKNYYGHDGIENWEMLCRRVADTISKKSPEMTLTYFNMLNDKIFLPNSPTLFGAGVNGLCYSACFVIPMEDSIEGWANSFRLGMKIQTAGGGCGFPLHNLRPKGFPVSGKRAKAAGPIEFMKCWDQISHSFSQAVRNGANMGFLRVDHPNIEDFISCKDKDGEISAFNISVAITDEFMKAVNENKDFELKWKDKVVKKIDARNLWNRICEHAWKTGEPGIMFYDTLQESNIYPEFGEFSTNPCSEYTGFMGTACNLGSINLKKFVDGKKFNYDFFKNTVRHSYQFLDDLIDVNQYPDDKIDELVKLFRPIGLGIMGVADMFIMLGIRYGSEESLSLMEKIMKVFRKTCDEMNEELANIRGPHGYSMVSGKFKNVRNITHSCVAPTGTISMIAGCSSGIEPIFSFDPIMRIMDGEKKAIHEQIKSSIPEVNVSANELSVSEHISVTSIVQKYVNMSISKTINLPNSATIEDVKRAYEMSWEAGIKGITVYRDGSRKNQTLQTKDSYKNTQTITKITPRKREQVPLVGETFKDKIGCGALFTTVNYDENGNIYEVFIRPGKHGGCQSNVEGLARMASIALRSGIDVTEIVDQLKGIRCPSCLVAKQKGVKFLSCPDAVGKAIEHAAKRNGNLVLIKEPKIKEVEYEKCEECSAPIVNEGGCKVCKSCGWSKCG